MHAPKLTENVSLWNTGATRTSREFIGIPRGEPVTRNKGEPAPRKIASRLDSFFTEASQPSWRHISDNLDSRFCFHDCHKAMCKHFSNPKFCFVNRNGRSIGTLTKCEPTKRVRPVKMACPSLTVRPTVEEDTIFSHGHECIAKFLKLVMSGTTELDMHLGDHSSRRTHALLMHWEIWN